MNFQKWGGGSAARVSNGGQNPVDSGSDSQTQHINVARKNSEEVCIDNVDLIKCSNCESGGNLILIMAKTLWTLQVIKGNADVMAEVLIQSVSWSANCHPFSLWTAKANRGSRARIAVKPNFSFKNNIDKMIKMMWLLFSLFSSFCLSKIE